MVSSQMRFQSPLASRRARGSRSNSLLAYINDMPEQFKSKVRLFADDTAMYLAISSTTEGQVLQTGLACLEQWEKMWDMQFNPSKCQVLHITRNVKALNAKYVLHVELKSASAAKYLGVTIADDLTWSPHIDDTTKKANQTLGFLKRNLRVHNKDLKSVAYKTLVRLYLEYASTVWCPHHDKDINKVEAVQRRAARWAPRDYKYTSSVTAMLKDLNWRLLDQHRIDSRLLMMYKVKYSYPSMYLSTLFETQDNPDTFTLLPIDRSIHTKTITDSHLPPELSSTGTPTQPIYQFSLPWLSLEMLSAG